MNERLPSPGRFFDWGIRWQLPAAFDDGLDDEAAASLDVDQVPTRDELEAGVTGPVISVSEGPHAIALPEVYEPGYAYPLIVWFHPSGSTEEELFDVLPQISDRNYVALALRGNVEFGHGADWSTAGGALETARRVEEAVERLKQFLNIHPQRIILAGYGSGGTTALEVLLQSPEAFHGAACLAGAFPNIEFPLARYRGLRGRRVLLATTLDCREVRVADFVTSGRLLYTAGMQVATRVYQEGGGTAKARMLRDVDHWIMDGIQSAIKVFMP
uniref:Uncharacterized protein n=1 Tax=Schlesneria paludicola TaxID=360056 RepID=A0A7C4QR05_9PLAN